MNSTPRTLVAPADPASVDWLALQSRLADLALGSSPSGALAQHTLGRHLAFLPPEILDVDLTDPQQRDFGDYELLEKLGQGGMGVVYRARQKSLDRDVAVKLLAAGPWASRDFIERFQREAQSAARMQHPNIVPIFEVGAHDELNYFSMALVRGESLAALLSRDGPQAPKRAAELLRTVAEAVDYAHRLGVLHLDLKPGNVLLDERGEPQVADFGLARRLDDTLAADSDEVSGTPSYMAPEQATLKSRKLTPATDVYGLGAILYELLSGRPPFLGVTPQETLKQVVGAEPARLRALRPGIPADLEAICLKCLEKDPRQRYAGARALVEDLGRFLEGRAVSVRPLNALQRAARWARREPRVAASAAAFVFALASGLVATAVQWRRADANAIHARENVWAARAREAQVALADGDGFRGLRPLVQNLAEMEAAGRTADAEVERQRIGTVLANAPQLIDFIRLPTGELVTSVAISPDGVHVAVATQSPTDARMLRQFEIATLREVWATPTDAHPGGSGYIWSSPHGQIVYSPDGHRIVARTSNDPGFAAPMAADAIALDARDGRVLTPPDPAGDLADVVYSDDARYALVRYRAERSNRLPDAGQFFATDGWRALGPRLPHDGSFEWLPTPDGRWLLGSSVCCRFTLFEPATLTPRWHVELPADDPVRAWRFSADASVLALGTVAGAVYLVDTRDGRRAALSTTPVATVRWLEFSTDASTLVTVDEDGGITAWDVATRKPRATPIRPASRRVSISSWRARIAGDSLYVELGSELRSWDLALPAPYDNLAVPGAARVRNRRDIDENAFDLHLPTGLLIVGGADGTLGLWRLPPTALLRARAAPLLPRAQTFDGERIVAVDGTLVQLLDAATLAPLSPAFAHPDPVQFAELGFDGRSLVTVAGRTVRVLDPASGALRGEPVVLPQTPLRADLASASAIVALSTGEYDGDVFHERIHVIDLEDGRLRAHAPSVPGPIDELNLDPNGRFVVVTTMPAPQDVGATSIVDLTGAGRRCGIVDPGDGHLFGDRAIAGDGRSAWFALGLPARRWRLLRWDLHDCRPLARVDFPSVGSQPTLMASADGVVAHKLAADALTVVGADGRGREVRGLPGRGAVAAFALSRDGRRAAQATRNAVLLIDLARGEQLSAPLAAPIAGNDAIARLAFSPDATQLLARTIKGRWLRWSLPLATQDVVELATLATLLDPDAGDPEPAAAAAEELRRRLRAADARIAAQSGAREWPRIELAAASGARPDPRFVPLDLAAALNVPLNGPWPMFQFAGGDLVTLAPGPQRLNGIDWRVDGGIQLSWGSGPPVEIHPTQRASAVVPVPLVRARRAHVLMFTQIELRADAPPRRAAAVVLIGADGRETLLEILTVRDLVMHQQPGLAAPTARIGWVGPWVALVRLGLDRDGGLNTHSRVYAVSLDVPPGIGPLRGLRLEVGDGPMEAPLFYAVTLETAGASPDDPARESPR